MTCYDVWHAMTGHLAANATREFCESVCSLRMVPLAPGNGLMLRRVKYGFSDAATLASGRGRWMLRSDTVAIDPCSASTVAVTVDLDSRVHGYSGALSAQSAGVQYAAVPL